MLRVTVEIWGGGNSLRPRTMAVINVSNISELAEISDYNVHVNINPGRYDELYTLRQIKGHRRSLGWGVLIARVAESIAELPILANKLGEQ